MRRGKNIYNFPFFFPGFRKMDFGPCVYVLIFVRLMGYDDFFLLRPIEDRDLTMKGVMKSYLFKLTNVIQCETTYKMIFIAICINIAYERWLNY